MTFVEFEYFCSLYLAKLLLIGGVPAGVPYLHDIPFV